MQQLAAERLAAGPKHAWQAGTSAAPDSSGVLQV